MYGYIPQYIPLTKDEILSRITEEEIFSYVLQENVEPNRKYLAPYRNDNNAGCFFSFYEDKIYFVDFGDSTTHKNCFHLFMQTFKVEFRECLQKINEIFGLGLHWNLGFKEAKNPLKNKSELNVPKEKEPTKFLCYTRDFNSTDLKFWNAYGISKEQLIQDKVFPIVAFKSKKDGKPYIINNLKQSYVYSDFDNNKVKIYSPYSTNKWLTNLSNDDIGNINNLPQTGKRLVITKSYKDCRVLRNFGLNAIWLQNERCVPKDYVFKDLLERFEEVYVFFDNDSTGLGHTKVILNKLKSFNTDKLIVPIIIPPILGREGIKDVSDYYKNKGRQETINFLKTKIK